MGTTTFFGESGQVSLSCVPYTFVVVTLMINFLKTCQFTNSTLYYFFGQVFVYMNCTYAKVILAMPAFLSAVHAVVKIPL